MPRSSLGVGSARECDFLVGCFDRHAQRRVRRLFEPACGSGRLLVKLAQRGFKVLGWDLSGASVDYCNRRLKRHGLPPAAALGDIVNVTLPAKVETDWT